jgi:hypothetical protein
LARIGVLAAILCSGANLAISAEADPLPSWNDGAANTVFALEK